MRKFPTVLSVVLLLALALGMSGCTSTKTEVTTEEIPFKTLENPNPSRWAGDVETITAGVPGQKEVTWKVSYQGGKEVTRTPLSERELKAPVDALVEVGVQDKATGLTWAVAGALLSVVDVQRTDSYRGVNGDLLLVKFKVDNVKGKKAFESATRTKGDTAMYLLWGGNFSRTSYSAAVGGPATVWLGNEPAKGKDMSNVKVNVGKSGTFVMMFDLNPGSLAQNEQVSDPSRMNLLWGPLPIPRTGASVYVNNPLSKFWIQSLN